MTTNTPTNGQLYDVLRKMLAAMAFEPNLTHPYGSLINDLEPTPCPTPTIRQNATWDRPPPPPNAGQYRSDGTGSAGAGVSAAGTTGSECSTAAQTMAKYPFTNGSAVTGAAQSKAKPPPPWYFNGADTDGSDEDGSLLILEGEYNDSFDIGSDAEAKQLAKCINAALSYWKSGILPPERTGP